jgi:hypothetical protein
LHPHRWPRGAGASPLLVGCAIIPFLFRLRRSLEETARFLGTAAATRRLRSHAIARGELVLVIIGTLMVTMTTVSFYMIHGVHTDVRQHVLHLTSGDSLIVTLCVGASNLFWLPVMGAFRIAIGRRPLLGTARC